MVWQQAEKNVPGLPPCPAGMREPQYGALMFFKDRTVSLTHLDYREVLPAG